MTRRISVAERIQIPFDEAGFFFRRWLAHPLRVSAVLPSSRALSGAIARQVAARDGEYVLELGPGTGRISQAIIDAGVPEDCLITVEIDEEMWSYLRRRFPAATIILGDASDLDVLLPAEVRGRVSTIVSGLPLLTFATSLQRRILEGCFAFAAPDAVFLQYSYSWVSPLPKKELGLDGQCVSVVWNNLPPATVWTYRLAVPGTTR